MAEIRRLARLTLSILTGRHSRARFAVDCCERLEGAVGSGQVFKIIVKPRRQICEARWRAQ